MIICFVRLSIFRLIKIILFTRFIKIKTMKLKNYKLAFVFSFLNPHMNAWIVYWTSDLLRSACPHATRAGGEARPHSRAEGPPPAWHGNKDQLLVWLGTAVNTPRPGLPLKPPMLTPQRRSVLDESLVQCTLIVTVKQSCSQQRRQCLPVFGSSFALIIIVG